MRALAIGVTILVQGFYALVWFLLLMDVASPTFNLYVPSWTGLQAVFGTAVLLTTAAALGVVMQTISRGVFHRVKEAWALRVLTSPTVRDRFAALGPRETLPGGVSYAETVKAEGADRLRRAGAFLHLVEYQLLVQAPLVWNEIQSYRYQYRLARGFVLTSAGFAFVLPLWDPLRVLDTAGSIGPFPLVRSQIFMLLVLASAICYVAFRERAYRYSAAGLLAYVTVAATEAGRRAARSGT